MTCFACLQWWSLVLGAQLLTSLFTILLEIPFESLMLDPISCIPCRCLSYFPLFWWSTFSSRSLRKVTCKLNQCIPFILNFFLMWIIFKVFIELVTILCLLFFGSKACRNLVPLPGIGHTLPCTWKVNLNQGPPGKSLNQCILVTYYPSIFFFPYQSFTNNIKICSFGK